jgi:hypothetical protein
MTGEAETVDDPPQQVLQIPQLSPEQLRAALLSDDANVRLVALTLTIQPDANIDGCVAAIASCVERDRDNPDVTEIAAAALFNVRVDAEKPAAVACMLTIVTPDNATGARVWAAHGIAKHGPIPELVWPHIAPMLFDGDEYTRKAVLMAIMPQVTQGAGQIAQTVASVDPSKWTTESLVALALSAGKSDDKRKQVENFLVRSIKGQPIFPTMIAGYAAMTHLNPKSSGPVALAKVAASADDVAAMAAIDAIARLGTLGSSAIPGLIGALCQTDVAAREDAICKALVRTEIRASDVPLRRVLQRIADAEPFAVVAYTTLLCMHAKSFASTASVVAARHATSGVDLQDALSDVHFTLTGKKLEPVPPHSAAKP